MNRRSRWIGALAMCVAVGTLVLGLGCAKKPKPSTEVTKEPSKPVSEETTGTETPQKPQGQVATSLEDVFFDYDKYNLREDARGTLTQDAQFLANDAAVNVILEGHCDERGTVEYNLALGERRAQSAKAYLEQFGIDPSRIRTVSYGEERPFATGHDESAWSQNRRVHFVKQ